MSLQAHSPNTSQPSNDLLVDEGGESPLIEQVVRRTTLADITGAMAQAANEIEDAINSGAEDADARVDAALARLDASGEPLERKIEACAYMRKSRQFEIAAIKAELKRLNDRCAALERQTKSWDAYVLRCLRIVGKIKLPLCAASIVKRKASRLVIDEDKLPSIRSRPGFWKRLAPKPNAEGIIAAIKDGEKVPGARLEDTEYVRWS